MEAQGMLLCCLLSTYHTCPCLSIVDFEQVNVSSVWSFNLYKITNHTSTVYFKTDRHDDPFDSKKWSFTCHPALKQTTSNFINSKNDFILKKNSKTQWLLVFTYGDWGKTYKYNQCLWNEFCKQICKMFTSWIVKVTLPHQLA